MEAAKKKVAKPKPQKKWEELTKTEQNKVKKALGRAEMARSMGFMKCARKKCGVRLGIKGVTARNIVIRDEKGASKQVKVCVPCLELMEKKREKGGKSWTPSLKG